ncbi:MAG TPA: hypothetical protein VI386_17930 [Candidatus Sulfotelmatobacter sp.]
MIESTQVRLRLISPTKDVFNPETGDTVFGKDVLSQLTKNRRWSNDRIGKYVGVQFDAHEFMFREGETITVSETIAKALIRSSAICVGSDKLNGPMVPFLEIAETYELGAPSEQKRTPTTCGICGEDQKTFPALTRHLGQERKKHPELFEEKKTDWDGEKEEVEA